jgi:hypothetical protein
VRHDVMANTVWFDCRFAKARLPMMAALCGIYLWGRARRPARKTDSKNLSVGRATLPGTAITIARSRAILPMRLRREAGPRGQHAATPCRVI